MASKKYKVEFGVMIDGKGNNRSKGEIVDAADIPEVERQLQIGAIVEATADEVKAADKAAGKDPTSPALSTGNQAGGVDQIAGEEDKSGKGKEKK